MFVYRPGFSPIVFVLLVFLFSGCAVLDFQKKNGLISAASEGDITKVKAALNENLNINKVNDTQRFALLEAASNGHLETVELLVAAGADVNQANQSGLTALMAAVSKGHEPVARYLIAQGADASMEDRRGLTALHHAVKGGGGVGLFKLLIDNGAPVNTENEEKETSPLFFAVENGHQEAADLLIANGAEVAVTDADKNTLLHMAAKKARPRLVRILINRGIDIHAKNKNGADALWTLAGSSSDTILENFFARIADSVEEKSRSDDTFEPAGQRHTLYQLLQELEGNFNRKALNEAIDNSVISIEIKEQRLQLLVDQLVQDYLVSAALLLDAGASVNTANRRGATVIIELCKQKACAAEVFKKNRVSLASEVEQRLNTACDAAERIHNELIQLFINTGADVAARDENEQTALMHACENGHIEYVRLLLEHGAEVNKANYEGWTPLIYAAANEDVEMAKLLIDEGAAVNAQNTFGETALLKAVYRNNGEIAELLVKNGADPDIKNTHHHSPRSAAKTYGYSKILKVFNQ